MMEELAALSPERLCELRSAHVPAVLREQAERERARSASRAAAPARRRLPLLTAARLRLRALRGLVRLSAPQLAAAAVALIAVAGGLRAAGALPLPFFVLLSGGKEQAR